jgi:4,5-dihydroxyphthalate decarboxylase
MSDLRLRTAIRIQGNVRDLVDGTVTPEGVSFDFIETAGTEGFRRMVRGLEFDVSEMPITTYLCAREHAVRLTALPVFLVRGFHHGAIVRNLQSRLETPKDLEGREVGVNRGYTVTTGVWARGILADEHGVDLNAVRWLRSGDEHVAEYQPPPNVLQIPSGKSIPEMLVEGELAAAVNVTVDHPNVGPLIPEPDGAALEALRRDGFYPINHLVVMRDDLLEAHPGLAAEVFEAFAEAKNRYVLRLREGGIQDPTAADRTYDRVTQVIGDPLPYGVEPNRPMIETLIRHAISQKIIRSRMETDQLFAKETSDLVA